MSSNPLRFRFAVYLASYPVKPTDLHAGIDYYTDNHEMTRDGRRNGIIQQITSARVAVRARAIMHFHPRRYLNDSHDG